MKHSLKVIIHKAKGDDGGKIKPTKVVGLQRHIHMLMVNVICSVRLLVITAEKVPITTPEGPIILIIDTIC